MIEPNGYRTKRALCAVLLAAGAVWLSAAQAGSPVAGSAAWVQEHTRADGTPARSCASCHTDDLTRPGRHAKTGKPIEAMAPSVNPERLTDQAKIEKWFRRNCRWAMGRECTAAEKTDFLAYIEAH